jgi:Domain of unknown function (DUF4381)
VETRNPTAENRRPKLGNCSWFFKRGWTPIKALRGSAGWVALRFNPFNLLTFLTHFGFRISDFFRPSAFGFRISCSLLIYLVAGRSLLADTNSIPEVPESSLRPARGEILPGFWEQYGGWVALASALLLLILAILIWLLLQPKPPIPTPPAAQARQELEPLRQRAEDGNVVSRVSQIIRHYVASMFALPPGELTTAELSGTLLQNQNIGAELGDDVVKFLRECDLRKFAPSQAQAPLDAVARALGLINRTESRVAELNQLAAARATDSNANRLVAKGTQDFK